MAGCRARRRAITSFSRERQTAPVRLSADGNTLFAVNTADGRLSVFVRRIVEPRAGGGNSGRPGTGVGESALRG